MIIADRTCTVDDCNNRLLSKGMCNKHYLRSRRESDPKYVARTKAYNKKWRDSNKDYDYPTNKYTGKKAGVFRTYTGLLNRKNLPNYKNIPIESKWLQDFEVFYKYIGDKPSDLYTLDRIDNRQGYIEGNVRWANRTVQSINRGIPKNNKSGVVGVSYIDQSSPKKWLAQLVIHRKRVLNEYFETFEQAAEARKRAEYKYHLPLLSTNLKSKVKNDIE